jgi:hypothetical protein
VRMSFAACHRHKEFREGLPSFRASDIWESPISSDEDHQQISVRYPQLIEVRAQMHHVEHLRFQYQIIMRTTIR